jgi:hypothetical protein
MFSEFKSESCSLKFTRPSLSIDTMSTGYPEKINMYKKEVKKLAAAYDNFPD